MVLAQTIVDAPKNGAIRRAAAISAPSEAAPTTNTSRPSGGKERRDPSMSDLGRGYHRARATPPGRVTRVAAVHPDERVGAGAGAHDRARRGALAMGHGGLPVHRRRLLAVVQRARPSPPADRRGRAGPARPGLAH